MFDSQPNKKPVFDRFITDKFSKNNYNFIENHKSQPMELEEKSSYDLLMQKEMLNQQSSKMIDETGSISNQLYPNNHYLASIKNLMTRNLESYYGDHHENIGLNSQKHIKKTLNPAPQKILDAPDLKDDYYLNLLDWSAKGTLAIGLAEKVYLYSTQKIGLLCQKEEDDYICSLAFHPTGDQLAVGLSNGKTQLYDVQTQTLIRTLKGHSNRVSSSAFTYGMLFTGSKDTKIIGHDYRSSHNVVSKFSGHRGQVCGLKHDPCGLASGSNDNMAIIWDLAASKMRYQLQGHKAAVKALAWCPWQRNLLATGGGSSDKTMRFWNIQSGKLINTVNTQSQVCSLIWNKNDRQILSSHGFSQNQLCLWKYSDCSKIVQLYGHTQRVLHMSLSPDNSTICTASADQTLRFWKVFQESGPSSQQQKLSNKLNPKYYGLR